MVDKQSVLYNKVDLRYLRNGTSVSIDVMYRLNPSEVLTHIFKRNDFLWSKRLELTLDYEYEHGVKRSLKLNELGKFTILRLGQELWLPYRPEFINHSDKYFHAGNIIALRI